MQKEGTTAPKKAAHLLPKKVESVQERLQEAQVIVSASVEFASCSQMIKMSSLCVKTALKSSIHSINDTPLCGIQTN